MYQITNTISNKCKNNKRLISFCLIATFVWGMIAHASMFLHDSFSHDSLNEFNAEVFGNDWRIQLGRVFVPAYRIITRGVVTMPWLIGILSLLYIGIAVFLVIKIFKIQSKLMTILISGIFTVNLTVTATAATYIHDLDCNMIALLFAVLAVYLWQRYNKGFLFGMIPLGISLGLYQSYISVTITLLLIFLIMALLNYESFKKVMVKGVKGIGMLIGGGVVYLAASKIICSVTGISLMSGNYNSIDTLFSLSIPEIIRFMVQGYVKALKQILTVASMYSVWVVLIMIGIAGIIVLCGLSAKAISIKGKILTLVLIALLPMGMNVSYVLTGGMSHDLMHYAFWLAYLFVLLIAWWMTGQFKTIKNGVKQGFRLISAALVFVVLWGNIQTANATYFKKNLEQDANLSLFTRIVYSMEDYDGYRSGETPVVFVGKPSHLLNKIAGFDSSYSITGSGDTYVLGYAAPSYYQAYFDYILLNPAVMADSETWNAMEKNPVVEGMPYYPEDGCIAMIDGALVVKLGDLQE